MSETLPGVPRSAYYLPLDGLRAVAVLMVFFQHYGSIRSSIFAWGWTGVDIFFVLSGFLITGILYDSQHKAHRYRDFYMRRTLRIFPLYYFIWLAILVAAPWAAWHWDWHWALWPAYLGNYARFFFLHEPGIPYRFDSLSFGPPVSAYFGYSIPLYFGHFWSLCVEEQFYLIWPFVVYRVRRRETLMKICVAVLVATPLFRAFLCGVVPERYLEMELLYRTLPTRIDALLLGGLIALGIRGTQERWMRQARRYALAGGLFLLVALYLIQTKIRQIPFHGSATNWMGIIGFSLIDIFAAGVILECIHPGSMLGRMLSWKPLRMLGVISYGFYVYHDLFHDFYRQTAHRWAPDHTFLLTIAIALAVTLALATTSYLVLERPFLRLKSRFTSQVHTAPTA